MKNFIVKYGNVISVVLIVILLLTSITQFSISNSKSEMIESAKQELLEAKKPTEIEILKQRKTVNKEDIASKKSNIETLKKNLKSAQKEYEVAVRLDRCIETKAILLLSGTGEVNCTKDLNKFASYNLRQTKIDLGL